MNLNVVVWGEGTAEQDAAGVNVADGVAVDFGSGIDPDTASDPGVGFVFAFVAIGMGGEAIDDVVTDDVAGVGSGIGIVGTDGDGTTVGGSAVGDVVVFDDDGGDAGFDFNAFGSGAGDAVAFDQDAVDGGRVLAVADVDAFGVVLFVGMLNAVEAGVADGVVEDLDVLAAGFDGDRLLSNVLDEVIADNNIFGILDVDAPFIIAEMVVFDDVVAAVFQADLAGGDAAEDAVLLWGAVGECLGGLVVLDAAVA